MTTQWAYIKCENSAPHRVGYSGKGRLVLLDHDKAERRRHLIVHALGGEPCPCISVLVAWRNYVQACRLPYYQAVSCGQFDRWIELYLAEQLRGAKEQTWRRASSRSPVYLPPYGQPGIVPGAAVISWPSYAPATTTVTIPATTTTNGGTVWMSTTDSTTIRI